MNGISVITVVLKSGGVGREGGRGDVMPELNSLPLDLRWNKTDLS